MERLSHLSLGEHERGWLALSGEEMKGTHIRELRRFTGTVKPASCEAQLAYLPDGIEYRAVHPFDNGHGALAPLATCRLAATDTLDFFLDVLNRTDG